MSYNGVSFSMKTIETLFLLPKPMKVDGSFFTNAYIILKTNTGKTYIHIDASKPGFQLANLKTRRVDMYYSDYKISENIIIYTKDVRYYIYTYSWDIYIHRKPIYNSLSNFHWRLDTKITPNVAFTEHNVHGILGQTFQKNRIVVNGKLDNYTGKNYLKTAAQAEGVIDGTFLDYVMKSKTSEVFKYSVFDNTETTNELPKLTSAGSDESILFEKFGDKKII